MKPLKTRRTRVKNLTVNILYFFQTKKIINY